MGTSRFVLAVAVLTASAIAGGCANAPATPGQTPAPARKAEARTDLITEALMVLRALHNDSVITEGEYQKLRDRAVEHLAKRYREGRISAGQKQYLHKSCLILAEELREVRRLYDKSAIREGEFHKLRAAAIDSWQLTVTVH
jgi:hypothetical protein